MDLKYLLYYLLQKLARDKINYLKKFLGGKFSFTYGKN